MDDDFPIASPLRNWNYQGDLPGNVSNDFCYINIALHSPAGIYESSFLNYTLPRLQLQLAIIFILTQSLHLMLRRFHLPRLVSEIMAGIILGPTVLGQITTFQKTLFPPEGEVYLDLLSKIGYIFFIFLSGVKMDSRTVLRTGIKAWTIGVLTPIIPITATMLLALNNRDKTHRYRWPALKNIIGIQNLFPFPVIASMLVDLKIMNSELGRLALASALISDFVSNLINTMLSYGRLGQLGFAGVVILHSTVLTICLVLFIVFVGRPLCLWIVRNTPEGKPVSRFHVVLMSLMVLIVVLLTDNVGLNYQYGPFLLGLVVPDGPPLGATLVDRLETLVAGLLAPLLVTCCGMKVNLVELFDLQFIAGVWLVIAVCYLVKLASVFIPALICRVPLRDCVGNSL